jgi:hypothetical protein
VHDDVAWVAGVRKRRLIFVTTHVKGSVVPREVLTMTVSVEDPPSNFDGHGGDSGEEEAGLKESRGGESNP